MKKAKRTRAAANPARKAPTAPLPEAVPDEPAAELVPELEEAEAGDLQEVESELGISEWIDPDTGAPAEDSVPRLEDH